ncbi:AraC family transcriptional regulator ligand-binding domain-containing protein [Paracidovorax wautersii]|uniref:AraC-like DNA-binding protein n=1 Tax=Paracidovorax wautersii TaxID=1177982 RepID=A0ABU1ICV7_9BURK|nr:AraC family transcriptional regulator ligand-binding domain-containing protein [Paracidovorax wautersii]MDR6215059.1 AraC-like DNA-binding protein [Paracidovorax wautersii]
MPRQTKFTLDPGWQPLLKDLGLSAARVLVAAGLPEDLWNQEERGVTAEAYFRFWRAVEAAAGGTAFPVRLMAGFSAESFSPPLFAALCSAHLAQAVQRLARYKPLVAPMRLDVEVGRAGELTIAPRWLVGSADVPDSLQVTEVAFFLRLARLATRVPVTAFRVRSPAQVPLADRPQYDRFFGVPAEYGEAACIAFSPEAAVLPFVTANDGMWRVFEPDLRRRLSQLDMDAPVAERVRSLLLELIPSNAATVDVVTRRLGMSKRTLQRRLEAEGASFRALLNASRENLARHYLHNTTLSGGEIAFLLGFEDPNSFYRAFQGWTGQTPEGVRRAM